jgi:hypothetical protein
MLEERHAGRPLAEQLADWKRAARFSDRSADVARCIFERRVPLVIETIARETGVPVETVDRVLGAAMDMHTRWPSSQPTVLSARLPSWRRIRG